MKESFVPLAGARSDGEGLHVPHAKDVVKDAPRVDADQHLDSDEEHRLYRHYGLSPAASHGNGNGNGKAKGNGKAHRTSVDAPGIATGTYVDDRGEGRARTSWSAPRSGCAWGPRTRRSGAPD